MEGNDIEQSVSDFPIQYYFSTTRQNTRTQKMNEYDCFIDGFNPKRVQIG